MKGNEEQIKAAEYQKTKVKRLLKNEIPTINMAQNKSMTKKQNKKRCNCLSSLVMVAP